MTGMLARNPRTAGERLADALSLPFSPLVGSAAVLHTLVIVALFKYVVVPHWQALLWPEGKQSGFHLSMLSNVRFWTGDLAPLLILLVHIVLAIGLLWRQRWAATGTVVIGFNFSLVLLTWHLLHDAGPSSMLPLRFLIITYTLVWVAMAGLLLRSPLWGETVGLDSPP